MSFRTAGHSLVTVLISTKYRPLSLTRALLTWLVMAVVMFVAVFLAARLVGHRGWNVEFAAGWALIYPTALLLLRAFSTRRARQETGDGV